VIGAGVAMFIMYLSTFASLRLTQRTYYERYRFAHVFAGLTREWSSTSPWTCPGCANRPADG
jgi:hypothetical protein